MHVTVLKMYYRRGTVYYSHCTSKITSVFAFIMCCTECVYFCFREMDSYVKERLQQWNLCHLIETFQGKLFILVINGSLTSKATDIMHISES